MGMAQNIIPDIVGLFKKEDKQKIPIPNEQPAAPVDMNQRLKEGKKIKKMSKLKPKSACKHCRGAKIKKKAEGGELDEVKKARLYKMWSALGNKYKFTQAAESLRRGGILKFQSGGSQQTSDVPGQSKTTTSAAND